MAVTTAGALPVFLTGALSVQMRASLTFDEAALGMAVAAFFAAAAACSALSGHLAERFGPGVMSWATVASAAALIAIGAGVRSWPELVGALVLAGIGNGTVQPAANVLLARSVDPDHQGWAFGVKQAAIPTATLLGGLAVPAVALTVGWRFAFIAAGCLALVVGWLVPHPGSVSGGFAAPDGAPLGAKPRGRRTVPASSGLHAGGGAAGRVRVLPLVVFAFALALGAGAANALGTFVVPAAVNAGVSRGQAGLLSALGSVAGLSVRLLSGRQADRRGHRHLPVVALMMVGGAVGYGLLATGASWLLIPGVVISFGAGWGWAGLFNFAIVRTHPGAPGRATGITQTGAYTGGLVGPLGFGLLAQHVSYQAAWTAAGAAGLLAAAGIVAGRHLLIRARTGSAESNGSAESR
ncbi:MAG: MFS transporter [Acidimicrobiales bacterium]